MNKTFRARAVATASNPWVTYLLNILAVVAMVGNSLLQTPMFPKDWTIWIVAVVGIANVLIRLLSELPVQPVR